jgi:hypothetical protein
MMQRTGALQEFLDGMARSLGLPTQAEADAADRCLQCSQQFLEAARRQWLDVDQREWAITHICPECWTTISVEDEDEGDGTDAATD